ncbi:MAG: toll/interleukin-1 receptor domain-containing protein [Candidatus Thiodiazotropha taylori]
MPDTDKLQILLEDIDKWNEYRRENPGEVIDFSGIDLSDKDLSTANLSGVNFTNSFLRGANLTRANLAGVDFSGSMLRGVNFHGAFLRGVNFTDVNLSASCLLRVDLRGASLRGLDFTDSTLGSSDLSGADLRESNFHLASLNKTDFSDANLNGANFSQASLPSTNFWGASLVQADFTSCGIVSTLFLDCDLTGVKGLDSCNHRGPSYLDIYTAQNSGPLPLVFLQGCGLSDEQIQEISGTHTRKVPRYSCFISYSSQDDTFAKCLYNDLQENSVRVWRAVEDMKGGQKTEEQIDKAIKQHQKLLLILSRESINSNWVKTEIAKAFIRENREKKRVLFPIRLVDFDVLKNWEYFDSDLGMDLAKEIRKYHIPDFSNWEKPDVYRDEFNQLLRDLKQEHDIEID